MSSHTWATLSLDKTTLCFLSKLCISTCRGLEAKYPITLVIPSFLVQEEPSSWLSGSAFVSGAGGLRFKTRDVLPSARHCCDISSKWAMLPACAMTRKWARPTRYTLRHNTESIIKDLIWVLQEAIMQTRRERRSFCCGRKQRISLISQTINKKLPQEWWLCQHEA